METPFDFGHLIEGLVERDPLTGACYIAVLQNDDSIVRFDVQEALGKLVGKEVRLTLASFEIIERIADLVEQSQAINNQA
jgi:hypothetical protein